MASQDVDADKDTIISDRKTLLLQQQEINGDGDPTKEPRDVNRAPSAATECPDVFKCFKILFSDKKKRKLFIEISINFFGETMASLLLMFYINASIMVDIITRSHFTLIDHAIIAFLVIMFTIFALGYVSGAHVNPVITVGFASVGKFPWKKVPFYIVAQLLGGLLGTLLAKTLYKMPMDPTLGFPPTISVPVAFVTEFFITAQLMFLGCCVAKDARVTGLYAAVAVSSVIALSIIAAWPLSGACMNPVRILAPAIVTGTFKEYTWVYLVAPFLGSICGGWIHECLVRLWKFACAGDDDDDNESNT